MRQAFGIATLLIAMSSADVHAQTYRVLHSFSGLEGAEPTAILLHPDGNLYGTTAIGGASNDGTVFKLSPSGLDSILHSFNGADGTFPGGLILGQNGLLYGVALGGAPFESGTIFSLGISGGLTTLYQFKGLPDGFSPSAQARLLQDSSGNLFGTTEVGGAYNAGTVFKLDPSGTKTILHSFDGADGAFLVYGLTADSSGNLYGTTNRGGTYSAGTVYKVDASGAETVLHSFGVPLDPTGKYPWSGLAADSAGNFYGTTGTGGGLPNSTGTQPGLGTVFKITPSGVISGLHVFLGPDGDSPVGYPVIDFAGNLYGVTSYGGAFDRGVLFKIDPSGTFTVLHSFGGTTADGFYPVEPALVDIAGNIYGITWAGGTNGDGTVYEYSPSPQDAIASMTAYVNSLFKQGVLNSGQTNSLIKQLQQALKLIQSGKNSAAIDTIQQVVAEVNDLLSSGVLTQTQAASLIAGANSLIASLSA